MAMFSTTGSTPDRDARSRPTESSLSILGPGMKVTGQIDCEGVVKIEGTVEGTVRAGTQVLVAKGGKIIGDLHTPEAIIGGEVDGEIHADRRVEIQSSAVVSGDVEAARISVDEGGQINGIVRMTNKPSNATSVKAPESAISAPTLERKRMTA